MNLKKTLLSLLLLFAVMLLHAEIKIASVLGDNMVLQRNSEVKIWGTANAGQTLLVKAGWAKPEFKATADKQGKWLVKIPTTDAGGPYTITISSGGEKKVLSDILLGEVWLCSGQSNMEMPMAGFRDQPINNVNDLLMDADNSQIRLYTVKKASVETPQDTFTGNWSVANAETVKQFSAVGYMYARILQQKLKVPVGMICSSWGGSRIEAWIEDQEIRKFPDAFSQTTQEKTPQHHKASRLFNGMISPLLNFTIKGALWYQGESNISNYQDYAALMAAMVKNWRNYLGDFAFYYVQIAPYGRYNVNSAFQRDEQLKAMELIPNSGMACTIDIGEDVCIHPAEKYTVSKRLAFCSLAQTYGFKGIEFRPAVYKSIEIKDTAAIITFHNAGNGFTSFGKPINCFEIAGEDKIFYPATCSINQSAVKVWSTEVKKPVAVRYAFSNFPKTQGFLYNLFGLPVPSFRTDNWDK